MLLGWLAPVFTGGARASVESQHIRKEVLELSARHPRYDYRRITALLLREGFEVKPKAGGAYSAGGRHQGE